MYVTTSSTRRLCFAILVCALTAVAAQRRKYEEPKSQVTPLPRELPMVLTAETATLDFHVSPLLKTGGLAAQIRRSLSELIRDTHGETIVKLRAFVSGAGDARRVGAEVSSMFGERKLPLPVLSVVGVGGLGDDLAKVVIEAVVSTKKPVNPSGLAFFSGQTARNLDESVAHLRSSAEVAGVPPTNVVQVSCLTARIDDGSAYRNRIAALFPQAAITTVQALRDPADDSVTCEAIGKLQNPPASGSLSLLKEQRVALVNTRRLVFTGMQLTFGNYLDDARQAFTRLERAASSVNGIDAAVAVDAFSLDAVAASALRKTSSITPSTFTVHTVEALPAVDASSGIEAVLAPDGQGQH
jgi:enamine deaminase RidA (YjgF/YER057c/UK114 family)